MQQRPEESSISQFLTPEAMLTPGVAGSLAMMITNALAVNFNAPRAWTGLVLSFVFGLLVLGSRLIKSTIQEQRRGRQRPDNFVPACRSGSRYA